MAKSYEDLIAALDKSVENNEIRVGDLVLWGFEKNLLPKILFGDPINDYQFPAMISYMSLQTGMRWSESISHVGMVAGFDETKKGAKSILTIESGGDFVTRYNGFMKHHLLNYMDPSGVRSIQIVRFWPDIDDKSRVEEFNKVLEEIVDQPPFKMGIKKYEQHKTDPDNYPESMQIGHSYNTFQLIQFATAALAANPDDPAFGRIRRAILDIGNKIISIPEDGSYFCSQAASEILHRVAFNYAAKHSKDYRIVHRQTFFSDAVEKVQEYNDSYVEKAPGGLLGTLDIFGLFSPKSDLNGKGESLAQIHEENKLSSEKTLLVNEVLWPGLVTPDDFSQHPSLPDDRLQVDLKHPSLQGSVIDTAIQYLLTAFAGEVLDRIRLDLTTQLNISPQKAQELLKMSKSIPLHERMEKAGIDYGDVQRVVRSSTVIQPKVPLTDAMKKVHTNVFGFICPSDFSPKIIPLVENVGGEKVTDEKNGGGEKGVASDKNDPEKGVSVDKNDTEKGVAGKEYHYRGADLNDPHVKTVFLF